jgi:hypothetical protein
VGRGSLARANDTVLEAARPPFGDASGSDMDLDLDLLAARCFSRSKSRQGFLLKYLNEIATWPVPSFVRNLTSVHGRSRKISYDSADTESSEIIEDFS